MKSNNFNFTNISYGRICFHCIYKLLIDSAILYFVYHVHKLHFPSVTFGGKISSQKGYCVITLLLGKECQCWVMLCGSHGKNIELELQQYTLHGVQDSIILFWCVYMCLGYNSTRLSSLPSCTYTLKHCTQEILLQMIKWNVLFLMLLQNKCFPMSLTNSNAKGLNLFGILDIRMDVFKLIIQRWWLLSLYISINKLLID